MHCRQWLPGIAAVALVAGLRADNSIRIVRLSLVTGAVQMNLPDGQGWRPALLNAPLAAGEQLRTLGSGRAEIQFEHGSTLRLIPDSTVTLTRLERSDSGTPETTVKLDQGVVFATLRKGDDEAFRLLVTDAAGRQIEATPDGPVALRLAASDVQVYTGKARLTRAGGVVSLDKQQQVALSGAALAPMRIASPADPWTRWSLNRDSYYEVAFKHGVEPGSLTPAVNWSGQLPPMPTYTGTGLAYLANSSCTWTQISGDYQGWCWTADRGWFRPDAAPTPNPAASAGASDTHQTQGQLISTARPVNSWGNLNFYGGMLGGPMIGGGFGGPIYSGTFCDPFSGMGDLGLDAGFGCGAWQNGYAGGNNGVLIVYLTAPPVRRPHRPPVGSGGLRRVIGSGNTPRRAAAVTQLHPPPASSPANARFARRGFGGMRAPLSRVGLETGTRFGGPGVPARSSFSAPRMSAFRGSSSGGFSSAFSGGARLGSISSGGSAGSHMGAPASTGSGGGPVSKASAPVVH